MALELEGGVLDAEPLGSILLSSSPRSWARVQRDLAGQHHVRDSAGSSDATLQRWTWWTASTSPRPRWRRPHDIGIDVARVPSPEQHVGRVAQQQQDQSTSSDTRIDTIGSTRSAFQTSTATPATMAATDPAASDAMCRNAPAC
jgi:hypothetical protein